tara:strand:- start:49 stop:264 length:216 start_codon:yes stop_codon:yes gene_type:complete
MGEVKSVVDSFEPVGDWEYRDGEVSIYPEVEHPQAFIGLEVSTYNHGYAYMFMSRKGVRKLMEHFKEILGE